MFVTTNVACPTTAVHAPATDKAGGGGGGTQRLISASAVSVLSLGLDNEYVLEEPLTLMTVLPPADSWKVPVSTTTPLSSVTL